MACNAAAGHRPRPSDLPPPPGAAALRLASFGEPEAAARLAMLYLQSFDFAGTTDAVQPARLHAAGRLAARDPRARSAQPVPAVRRGARLRRDRGRGARAALALEFVYQEFLRDPNRRWPWLAHAALLAKHRLKDLPLARRYAAAIERHTTARDVPLWAKQMEIFILEDMNELEAARIMLGGLLQSGTVRDPAELRFLKERLQDLEERIGASKR